MKTNQNKQSIWTTTAELPPRSPLAGNLKVEAAVIGAGMAGILTAYLLKNQGIQVIVLEADRIASGQTKNTTAKITSQHGMVYHRLMTKAGKQRAKLYADANEAAILEYEKIVRTENIQCHFEKLPSYLYTTDPARREELRKEGEAAKALGISARFTQTEELPFKTEGAVCFENQAQFHPLEFIRALTEKVPVYEKTRVLRVRKHRIETDRGIITADHIVFATHYPFVNFPGFFFVRLHQERSYCLGITGTKKLEGMYYGIDKGGLSLKWAEDVLLLGGGSHRTGKNRTGNEYQQLKTAARQYFPHSKVIASWSAQDCISHDHIPFMGKYSVFRPYWHVATGFKKWGMTSSMVSAMIIRDRICGLKNPYETLFKPQRCIIRASTKLLLTDLWESSKGLTEGFLHLPLMAESLTKGQGKIVRIGLKKYACYKDQTGTLHKISPKCPHLGCELKWNPEEQSWDCPCHGSRFDYDGNLIDNPAQKHV